VVDNPLEAPLTEAHRAALCLCANYLTP